MKKIFLYCLYCLAFILILAIRFPPVFWLLFWTATTWVPLAIVIILIIYFFRKLIKKDHFDCSNCVLKTNIKMICSCENFDEIAKGLGLKHIKKTFPGDDTCNTCGIVLQLGENKHEEQFIYCPSCRKIKRNITAAYKVQSPNS